MLLIILGAGLRFGLLPRHFTHVDDIGVAATLIQAQSPEAVTRLFDEKRTGAADNPRIAALRTLRTSAWGHRLEPLLVRIYPWISVPVEWTYAPAQFFLTTPLLHPNRPFSETLIRGRLPSCLAGLAGLLLVAALCRLGWPGEGPLLTLCAVGVMALSLEHIIFSVHMGSYALGSGTGAATAMLALWIARHPAPAFRTAFLSAVGLTILLMCHYQAFLFVPAFFVVLAFGGYRNRLPWRVMVRHGMIIGVLYLLAWAPVYRFRFQDMTTAHWNQGPAGEFVFSWDEHGVLSNLIRLAVFLAQQGGTAFAAMISPVPESSMLYRPLAVLFAILIVAGIVTLWTRRDEHSPIFLLFTGGFVITLLGLIIPGRLPLSPTRHYLIALPLLAILTAHGVLALGRRMKRPEWLVGGWIALLIAGCLISFPGFLRERKAWINEERLASLLEQYDVATVVTMGSTARACVQLMPSLQNRERLMLEQGIPEERTRAPWALFSLCTDALPPQSPLPAIPLRTTNAVYLAKIVPSGIRHAEIITSETDTELSHRIRNGANNGFLIMVAPDSLQKMDAP